MIDNFIDIITSKLNTALAALKSNGIKRNYTFEIDCECLKDYNYIDIRDSIEFRDVFKSLEKLKGPTLYWIEIKSNTDNVKIREYFENYSASPSSKRTPAIKKHFDINSKCLYVGKVKKTVWGRMIQHLGFYKVDKTQGLQLFYWSKGLNLKLVVHLCEFDENMSDLISIFEIELAKQMNPIIGKH